MKKLLVLFVFFACSHKETSQQKAEDAVKKYVKQNAHVASSYQPISFGKLDTVYSRDTATYWHLDIVRKNLVARYRDAKKRGDEALTDSLQTALINIDNKMDAGKTFNGLKIYHVSQGKNELGEMVMNRGTFYLDSNFAVKDFVMTEDSLLTESDNAAFR